jgi:hypothetical protein
VFGLFLVGLQHFDFWLVVLINAALTVWIVALMLRVYGLGSRAALLAATMAALSVVTTLPWLTSVLLTDIFCGLAVLALHLVLLKADVLARWERVALVLLIAFAAASHSATFALLLALLMGAAMLWASGRRIVRPAALARGVAALGLGAAMLLTANFALSGKVAWTPGGYGILFGRLLQDGIVKQYLDDHCPDPRLRLCPHRNALPATADAFLWGDSVFNDLGRFAGLDPEMRTIVLGSLQDYPLWQVRAALTATARQFVAVGTGEGVVTETWHSRGIIERYLPHLVPPMMAARQQRAEFAFDEINRLHVPVALGSILLLLGLILLTRRRARDDDLGMLATTVAVAILANAAICGILSNPHDRYGARIVWLATFVVLIALWRWIKPQSGFSRDMRES